LWPFGFPEGFLLLYLEFRIKIFDKKMEVGNLIGDIINIPTQFQELGNVTFPHLLRNYGYFALFSHITEDKILEELNRHPEWVQQWLNYSAILPASKYLPGYAVALRDTDIIFKFQIVYFIMRMDVTY